MANAQQTHNADAPPTKSEARRFRGLYFRPNRPSRPRPAPGTRAFCVHDVSPPPTCQEFTQDRYRRNGNGAVPRYVPHTIYHINKTQPCDTQHQASSHPWTGSGWRGYARLRHRPLETATPSLHFASRLRVFHNRVRRNHAGYSSDREAQPFVAFRLVSLSPPLPAARGRGRRSSSSSDSVPEVVVRLPFEHHQAAVLAFHGRERPRALCPAVALPRGFLVRLLLLSLGPLCWFCHGAVGVRVIERAPEVEEGFLSQRENRNTPLVQRPVFVRAYTHEARSVGGREQCRRA